MMAPAARWGALLRPQNTGPADLCKTSIDLLEVGGALGVEVGASWTMVVE